MSYANINLSDSADGKVETRFVYNGLFDYSSGAHLNTLTIRRLTDLLDRPRTPEEKASSRELFRILRKHGLENNFEEAYGNLDDAPSRIITDW